MHPADVDLRRGLRLSAAAAVAAAALLALGLAGCGDDAPQPQLGDDAGPAGGSDAAPEPDAGALPGSERRFAMSVIPDTQYLFDRDRGNADVLAASLHWIVDHAVERQIAFSASLGDIVENAGADEMAEAREVYRIFDDAALPYSVLAGNHDLHDQGPDDQRASGEPYIERFGPDRMTGQPGYGGASPGGFNSSHVFEGGGRQWLLLALDWRVSDASIAWAQGVLDAHPTLPAIVTTHELAYEGGDGGPAVTGDATLSFYGEYLWDHLIRGNDQIFLTINGHFWPSARTVMRNDAGHEVHVHVTNYQNRYYGGSGMIRLYDFDLERNRIEVSTFSPWVLAQAPADRNPLAQQELELVDADNRFTIPLDFASRFAAFSGDAPPEPPELPAKQVVIEGTVAYWRFDGGAAGTAVPDIGVAVPDLSGNGNDLVRVTLANGATEDLAYAAEYDPRQPSRSSLFFDGSRADPALNGAYLRTIDGAMLETETFESGYTIEAFLKLPPACCDNRHAWMGILTRLGTGGDLGRTADDPEEPIATMTVPPGGGLQWAVWPTSNPGILTNWSHELLPGPWIHVAIVNDGQRTIMYIDGALVLRNPRALSIGIPTIGGASGWLVGAYHYGHIVEQSFYGWLGDVRIVARALTPAEFMIANR